MNDTTAEAPVVYKRVTVDGAATLDGLVDVIAKISSIAPQSASIVTVIDFFDCGGHDDDNHEQCDPKPHLSFTCEWPEEDQS